MEHFKHQHEFRILLVYVYAESHNFALENLRYFVANAVRSADHVDYYFILQENDGVNINETTLPPLPNNAHYIHHENTCFDYGTIGWFLSKYTIGNPHKNESRSNETKLDLRLYKYFIFMNSSTRGPYLPPYFVDMKKKYESISGHTFYWYSLFIERITKTVKLVGPTISCEISPHIQNYVVATDFIGLSIVLKSDGINGVFDCHEDFGAAIRNGEVGFTKRILEEGYMAECLMRKYQRLNFSSPENILCNSMSNPHLNNGLDYISLDPYEIVFIKYNYKRKDWLTSERGRIYDLWTLETVNNATKYGDQSLKSFVNNIP